MAKTQRPAPQRAPQGISIKNTSSSQVVGNYLKVTSEIGVFRGSVPISTEVVLKDGVKIIPGQTTPVTTVNGVALYEAMFPLSDKEVTKTLRVCLVGLPDEISHTIIIPAKQAAKDAAETAFGRLYTDKGGRITFTASVIDTDGGPIPNKVITVSFKGLNYKVKTDKEGIAVFPEPNSGLSNVISLKLGEEEDLFFYVPGIRENKKLKAIRKKPLKQAKAFTKKWWLGVNNGRAFLCFVTSLLLLFITIMFGVKPMISDGIFSGENGLTSAQTYHNEIMTSYGYLDQVIAPIKVNHGVPWWIISILLVLASLVYMIIAAREEIADAFDDLKIKIAERNFVKTNDPFIERLIATSVSMGIISNKKRDSQNVSSSTTDTTNTGGGVKSLLTSNLVNYLSLDLVTDFIRGLIKRVFGK